MPHFMHSWRGSNTTIINNNFFRIGAPMCRPRPVFFGGGGCCGGGMNMMNMFTGFAMTRMFMGGMSNLFGFGGGQSTMPSYYSNGYTPYRSSNNDKSCNCTDYSAEIKDLTNQVANLKNELEALQNKDEKEVTLTDGNKQEVKDQEPIEYKDNQGGKVNKDKDTEISEETETEEEQEVQAGTISKKGDNKFNEIADKVLNSLDKDLNDTQKSYVKNKITEIYQDEDGNIKYNITAVAHDTDSTADIAKRFYKDGEKPDFTVGTANFNTQQSETNKLTDPHSGNVITLNGVSSFGLAALMQDAKDGVTSQGEITKTNKRIAKLKEDFEAGNKKLSWAYVNQNKIMDKASYDAVISSKYSE